MFCAPSKASSTNPLCFDVSSCKVPLGLDNPYWVEDDAFNLEAHVHHIALPQPGDWHQFSNQLAHLHARILDRSRPLWEAYVIEGLDNVDWLPKDSFAIFLKIHHAAIDGVAGLEIVSAIHDREPVAPPQAAGVKSRRPVIPALNPRPANRDCWPAPASTVCASQRVWYRLSAN